MVVRDISSKPKPLQKVVSIVSVFKKILDMQFVPFHTSTLVSQYSSEELYQKMVPCVRPADERKDYGMAAEYTLLGRPYDEKYPFEGLVKPTRYQLRKSSFYPEHFMPIVNVKLEETSLGCIVSMVFRLPGGTLFIAALGTFVFWCILAVFLFVEKNYLSATLIFLFWFAGYFVMLLNFQQKLKVLKGTLYKILQ